MARLGTLRVRGARTRQRAGLPACRGVGRHTDYRSAGQGLARLPGDARIGLGRGAVSSGAAHRRLAVSVSGWSEPAGPTPQLTETGQALSGHGVRVDGTRHVLAFTRSTDESQAAWEGLLHDLYRRGLEGRQLQLIVTDGCAGLAAELQTHYPRVEHQRCWVHKLRNLLTLSRGTQISPVMVIENSPPWLGRR